MPAATPGGRASTPPVMAAQPAVALSPPPSPAWHLQIQLPPLVLVLCGVKDDVVALRNTPRRRRQACREAPGNAGRRACVLVCGGGVTVEWQRKPQALLFLTDAAGRMLLPRRCRLCCWRSAARQRRLPPAASGATRPPASVLCSASAADAAVGCCCCCCCCLGRPKPLPLRSVNTASSSLLCSPPPLLLLAPLLLHRTARLADSREGRCGRHREKKALLEACMFAAQS